MKDTCSTTSNEQTLLPPIGTNLELVDDNEVETEHHTGTGDSTHTLDSQPATETRRYRLTIADLHQDFKIM